MASHAHPWRERPELTLEQKVELYRELGAQLHDQIWWMQLSPERRAAYEAQGFRAPIIQFYDDDGPDVP